MWRKERGNDISPVIILRLVRKDFDSAVKRLKEEAGRRAEEMNLLLKRNEEGEKTEETGGDRRCPSFPDGAEMGG